MSKPHTIVSDHKIKRAFDLVLCIFALAVCILPMVIIGLLVCCTSPGPALYRQERLGLHGKPFLILKFRTMIPDAEAGGIQQTQVNDPRITTLGRTLRRYHLDELPQLVNILRGEMSFVGPRPERAYFYEQYDKADLNYTLRLDVLPGLTGWAQVHGGYDLPPAEKLQYDLAYIQNRSLWMDLRCIALTLQMLITGEGSR